MSQPTITILHSIDRLRAIADAWDDLWSRSGVTMPTARAELVAQWYEQFAANKTFRAVIVEQDGRLTAAIALVGKQIGPLVEAAALPSNEWSPCGELLLDEATDVLATLDVLVAALDELPWPLLWLSAVPIQTARWRLLLEAVDRRGLAADYHERFQIGLLQTSAEWEGRQASWSKNHRHTMKKAIRNLEADGFRFRIESNGTPDQVQQALMRGFEVEDRSWKGELGTSILRSAGMTDYFVKQAQQLAEWGQLELAWIERNDGPIAFEYAWNAKRIYHSFKVGYDPKFARWSPGQSLLYYLLREFHGDASHSAIDCLGPISPAIERWKPSTYTIGRLVIAPRRLLGRMLVYAYKHIWPHVRQLRGQRETTKPRQPNQSSEPASCPSPTSY